MKILYTACVIASAAILSGCAPIYGNTVSKNQLGAAEYRPAVYVPPERQGDYEQLLTLCRQAATNRQVTAAQQAQLKTLTGATEDVTNTAMLGAGIGSMYGGDALKGAGIGVAAGLIGSLASSFSSGTENTAAKTRDALLNCLRTGESALGIKVLE